MARQVLALTHLVFFAEASTHPLPAALRGTIAPLAASAASVVVSRRRLMARVVRMLSQGWVSYRHSPLSLTGARTDDGPRPGDRVPDTDVVLDGRATRLHTLTARPGIHVLLHRDAPVPGPVPPEPLVHVHRIASWPGDGVLALRPDGHVGYASCRTDAAGLAAWLDLVAAPRPAPQTGARAR